MSDHGLDSARATISDAYDRPYRTIKQLYGVANDEDDFGPHSGEERVDSPFQQLDPRSSSRPAASLPPLTHFDDTGFAGLDAPLN